MVVLKIMDTVNKHQCKDLMLLTAVINASPRLDSQLSMAQERMLARKRIYQKKKKKKAPFVGNITSPHRQNPISVDFTER